MTSPFCWQPPLNPVSLGPRPKDLHTQVPKSRPLSEKGAELIRKRRIKHVFGSFNEGPFKGNRLCFGSSHADVTFQLPKDAYLPACDKHMPLPCDDDLHQHSTYRISLSLLLSHQTYPKAVLCSLHHHYIPPPHPRHRWLASCRPVSCAATPARKRDTRLAAAGFRPHLLRLLLVDI